METKTLIICGYATVLNSEKILYDMFLYGQSTKSPKVQFITRFTELCTCYDDMLTKCTDIYVKYFEVENDYNIVIIDNFVKVK